MELFVIVARNIFISLVSSIPGLLISRLLEKKGLVRRQSKVFYIGLLIAVALFCSMRVPYAHWIIYVFISLLVTILGIQRFELWYSYKMGRWWWLKEK